MRQPDRILYIETQRAHCSPSPVATSSAGTQDSSVASSIRSSGSGSGRSGSSGSSRQRVSSMHHVSSTMVKSNTYREETVRYKKNISYFIFKFGFCTTLLKMCMDDFCYRKMGQH